MRKTQLVDKIAEQTGVSRVDIMLSLDTFFKETKDALLMGESVYVRGFGTFVLKKRAAKLGRNIRKNTLVEIPEHFVPALKPSKEFLSAVKSIRPDQLAVPNDEETEE